MKSGELLLALKIFFCWILTLILFFYIGGLLFGDLESISLINLANWDGRHFLEVAGFGYVNKDQYAFFPFYPLLIKFVSQLLNLNLLYAGLIINLAAAFGSVYILLKITQRYGKDGVKATAFLLIFPTSFYLIAAYSESTFLFLSLLAFYFMEKKNFIPAALFASLSLLTRITGVAVIAGMAFYLLKATVREKLIFLLISLSGIGLYCLYLFLATGDPFYFFVSEKSWGRSLSVPGFNFLDSITYIAAAGVKPESYTILSDLVFAVFGIGMGIRSLRVLKPPLAAYAIVSLLIPLSTGILLSVPRFLAVTFSIFLVAAKINNRIFNVSYVIISLVLLFLYFNFFLRNIWVS